MSNYVLIHGAASGAHGFRAVRPLLQEAGVKVFTPSLTGMGDRAHLQSPAIGLTTHIQDVVNQILYEDLEDIVLLGFSYGAFPVTGALDHIGERVRAYVLEESVIPRDGESYLSSGSHPEAGELHITLSGEKYWTPGPDLPGAKAFGSWGEERRVPQSFVSMTEPLRLKTILEDAPFKRVLVKAGEGRPEVSNPIWDAADFARDHPAWRYEELASSHSINTLHPELLAKVLLDLG